MHTISQIVVGVDLHDGDRLVGEHLPAATAAAIAQSKDLALRLNAEVIYCACLDISPQALELISNDPKNSFVTVEDFAAKLMEKVCQEAIDAGVRARYEVRFGSAAVELTKLVQERQAGLLVIGAGQRRTLFQTIFGRTSAKLVQICPCPVWVVKPEEVREIREIAVCTDLSEESMRSLHAAIAFAHHLDARLFVLHAVEFPMMSYLRSGGAEEGAVTDYQKQVLQEAHDTIHRQLHQTDWRTLNHGIKVELLEGAPETVVPTFIEKNQVDLVVLTTHGRSGFSQFVMGSTVQKLLPVLKSSLLALKPSEYVSPVEI